MDNKVILKLMDYQEKTNKLYEDEILRLKEVIKNNEKELDELRYR